MRHFPEDMRGYAIRPFVLVIALVFAGGVAGLHYASPTTTIGDTP